MTVEKGSNTNISIVHRRGDLDGTRRAEVTVAEIESIKKEKTVKNTLFDGTVLT